MKNRLVLLSTVLSMGASASPFYPIPAYLSASSDKVKANVMLNVDTSGSMTNSSINGVTRLQIAKNAFTDLVSNNRDLVRWGYSTFHVADFVPIADNNATPVLLKINGMIGNSNTPTMPIYNQLMRYFQGLAPTSVTNSLTVTYNGDWARRLNNTTTAPPFQYRCQKNFVILLSDGDANVSSNASEYVNDSNFGPVYTATGGGSQGLPSFTKKAYELDFKTSGVDLEGKSWNDPNFRVQNIITYTIGFGSGMSTAGRRNLEDAANNGGGRYYVAGNSAELIASLQDALADISSKVIAQAPPTYVSDPTVSGAVVVKYKTANWSSDINVYNSNSDGSVSSTASSPVVIPNGTRNIYVKTDNGSIKSLVNTGEMANNVFGVSNTEMTEVFNWLKGSKVKDTVYRSSVLGDVINSNVSMMYQGKAFVVGANDGMVHAFKPNNVGTYVEAFAYMPTQAKSVDGLLGRRILNLIKGNYGLNTNQHKYFVDGGTFYRGDSTGSHVIVGSTGRGASGVYALDMANIRDNSSPNENAVLFDITHSNTGYNNLGYTVGKPLVVKVKDGGSGRVVALVNNGYYSTDISLSAQGIPTMYAVNLQQSKGTVFKEFLVPVDSHSSTNNGLSSLVAYDQDKDGYADFAYAGDLKGDLYKFNLLTGTSKKIFSGNVTKPITAAPVVFSKEGKTTIIFGTGKLLTESDNRSVAQQTVYGIVDDDSLVTESDLLQQEFISTTLTGYRFSTNKSLNATNKGWYINLGALNGERVIYQPIINVGTLFFTTQIINPPDDKLMCSVGSGSGYVMALDAETGGQPKDDNSKFGFDETGTGGYAGKYMNTFITGIGGMIEPPAMSAFGSDMYGQSIAGYVDPTYKEQKKPRNPCLKTSVTTEDRVDWLCVEEGIKPSEGSPMMRRLSWREIF